MNDYGWDCWYIFEPVTGLFHVFQLFAERHHRDAGQHGLYSRLLSATSHDLTSFGDVYRDVVQPSPDSSIWTGCTVRRSDGKYQLFYTERTTQPDYWAGQSIRCAVADILEPPTWQTESMYLTPDSVDPYGSRFLRRPSLGDRTVHAWRDPFVFGDGQQMYMLVSAKSASLRSACIALLRSTDNALLQWELVNESLVSGYEELEVPQLYLDNDSGQAVLIASTWGEQDFARSMELGYNPYYNEPNTSVRENAYLLAFRANDLVSALGGQFGPAEVVLGPSDHIYAGVVVPELSGAVLGFDVEEGNHRLIPNCLPSLCHPEPSLKRVGP
jgi:beta-fructofuranosidase